MDYLPNTLEPAPVRRRIEWNLERAVSRLLGVPAVDVDRFTVESLTLGFRVGGHLTLGERFAAAVRMDAAGVDDVEIASRLGVSPKSVQRYLAAWRGRRRPW